MTFIYLMTKSSVGVSSIFNPKKYNCIFFIKFKNISINNVGKRNVNINSILNQYPFCLLIVIITSKICN